jgi:hypothetical protein
VTFRGSNGPIQKLDQTSLILQEISNLNVLSKIFISYHNARIRRNRLLSLHSCDQFTIHIHKCIFGFTCGLQNQLYKIIHWNAITQLTECKSNGLGNINQYYRLKTQNSQVRLPLSLQYGEVGDIYYIFHSNLIQHTESYSIACPHVRHFVHRKNK